MIWLQLISKLIRVLREGASPSAIAGGFTLGFFIGLTPFLTLQNVVLLLLAAILRLNFAAFGFAYLIFSFIAYLFDPLFHSIGLWLLTLESLQGFYTSLYNMPIAPLTRFYNTLVAGSSLVGLILAPGIFFGTRSLVQAYRSGLADRINNSPAVRWFRGLKVVQWYFKIRDFQGA